MISGFHHTSFTVPPYRIALGPGLALLGATRAVAWVPAKAPGVSTFQGELFFATGSKFDY
jgi:hypothetical protein